MINSLLDACRELLTINGEPESVQGRNPTGCCHARGRVAPVGRSIYCRREQHFHR